MSFRNELLPHYEAHCSTSVGLGLRLGHLSATHSLCAGELRRQIRARREVKEDLDAHDDIKSGILELRLGELRRRPLRQADSRVFGEPLPQRELASRAPRCRRSRRRVSARRVPSQWTGRVGAGRGG